jgi:hypothetical protein
MSAFRSLWGIRSDARQKEGTIDSQVVELKRQIAAASHVLGREYMTMNYGHGASYCVTKSSVASVPFVLSSMGIAAES